MDTIKKDQPKGLIAHISFSAVIFFGNIDSFNFILMFLKFLSGVVYLWKASNPGKKSYDFLYKGK